MFNLYGPKGPKGLAALASKEAANDKKNVAPPTVTWGSIEHTA